MKNRDAWIVFGTALILRLVYLFFLTGNPLFDSPAMDSRIHDDWARQWAQPDLPVMEEGRFKALTSPFFRAPLYPAFLSLVYRVLDPSRGTYVFIRILQFILGSLSCVFVAGLARRVYGRRAGLAAGLAAALYWPFLYVEGELWLESLFIFLVLVSFRLLFEAEERRKPAWYLASGLAFGLSAITRPNILLFFPFLLAWMIRAPRSAVLVLSGIALGILPVTLHNLAQGDPVLISSQAGVNFYIGNNPYSDGRTAVVPGTRASWWGGFDDTRRLAEQALGRPLRASEVSGYWFERGLQFLQQEPAKALALYGLKLKYLFNPVEISNNQNIYFFRKFTWFLTLPFFLGFGAVAALGFAGLAFLPRDRRARLLALFALTHLAGVLVFFMADRYRLPVMPFLIIFGAGFAIQLWDRAVRRDWKPFSLRLALVLGLGILFQSLRLPAEEPVAVSSGDFEVASAYARKGQAAQAYEIFGRTVVVPGFQASSYLSRGYLDLNAGRMPQAEANFRAAVGLEMRLGEDVLNVLAEKGLDEMAEKVLITPGGPPALRLRVHAVLAERLARQRKYRRALVHCRKALEVDPANEALRRMAKDLERL